MSPWEVPAIPWSLRRAPVVQALLAQAGPTMLEGRLVWARPYRWGGGRRVNLGSFVYSFDPHLRCEPQALAGIADRLRQQIDPNRRPSPSVWMRQVQDDIALSAGVIHQRLPPSLTGRWAVYHGTALVWPALVPGDPGNRHAYPLLVGPGGAAFVLPRDRWPSEGTLLGG